MRRSGAVPLTLLATAALAGCNDHPKEVRNCVDADNHIVLDSQCSSTPSPVGHGGGGGFHYVYGGSSGESVGDTVKGGSSEPEPEATVVSGESGEVVRGGFGGGEGEGHAGGEGGHGGGEGGGE
jgi:hypothetical protein